METDPLIAPWIDEETGKKYWTTADGTATWESPKLEGRVVHGTQDAFVNKKRANPPGIYRKNWPGNASIRGGEYFDVCYQENVISAREKERLFFL